MLSAATELKIKIGLVLALVVYSWLFKKAMEKDEQEADGVLELVRRERKRRGWAEPSLENKMRQLRQWVEKKVRRGKPLQKSGATK